MEDPPISQSQTLSNKFVWSTPHHRGSFNHKTLLVIDANCIGKLYNVHQTTSLSRLKGPYREHNYNNLFKKNVSVY